MSLNSLVSSSVPTSREATSNLTKYFANMHNEEENNFKEYLREGNNLKAESQSNSRNSSLRKSRQ